MNSNGVIKARARWMLFFDASWTSTAVAKKIGGKSDATQLMRFHFCRVHRPTRLRRLLSLHVLGHQ